MTSRTDLPDSPDRDALLDRLGAELLGISRTVERIRTDMEGLRARPVAAPTSPAPTSPAPTAPPPTTPPPWRPPSWSTPPWHPQQAPPPPMPPRSAPPGPAAPPTRPRRSREGLGARLLAATGGAVTLLGVVLLLVLAARGGWFGPGAQVVAGALLGLGLAATGLRLRARHATGAVALVATGVAALYLDVAAASTLYAFLPVPVALLLGLGVLSGGLAVADRWRTPGLAVGVVSGLAVLVPVVAHDEPVAVAALLVVAALPAAVLAWRRSWSVPVIVATGAAVLGVLVAVLRLALRGSTEVVTVLPLSVAALALLGVAVALAVVGAHHLPLSTRVTLVLLAAPPVLACATLHGRWAGVVVAGLAAVALLATGWVVRRRTDAEPVMATVLEAAGAAAGFVATALALDGSSLAMLLLAQTAVLAVAALATGRRGLLLAALGYGFVGSSLAVDTAVPPRALTTFGDPTWLTAAGRDVPALLGAVATAVLLSAAAAAVLTAVLRLVTFPERAGRWVAAAVLGGVGLYGAATAVVALALLVSPTRAGFLTGHVVVTVSWTALALLLLARGLRDSAPRVLGAVLVAAAVAKLVLFDLVALDGIARVVAFLGAGIVLLVAGTRYASLVAREAGAEGDDEVRSGAGCG